MEVLAFSATTFNDLCQGDCVGTRFLAAQRTDAEASLGVEDTYDVTAAGERCRLYAYRFRTEPLHLSAPALHRCGNCDLHVLGVSQRDNHPMPACGPRAFTKNARDRCPCYPVPDL